MKHFLIAVLFLVVGCNVVSVDDEEITIVYHVSELVRENDCYSLPILDDMIVLDIKIVVDQYWDDPKEFGINTGSLHDNLLIFDADSVLTPKNGVQNQRIKIKLVKGK